MKWHLKTQDNPYSLREELQNAETYNGSLSNRDWFPLLRPSREKYTALGYHTLFQWTVRVWFFSCRIRNTMPDSGKPESCSPGDSQTLYGHSDSDAKKKEGVFQCHYSFCLPCLLWVSKRLRVRETAIRFGAHGHPHWQCQQGLMVRQVWRTGSCTLSHLPAAWWQILF